VYPLDGGLPMRRASPRQLSNHAADISAQHPIQRLIVGAAKIDNESELFAVFASIAGLDYVAKILQEALGICAIGRRPVFSDVAFVH
jgi:hypothetical protein